MNTSSPEAQAFFASRNFGREDLQTVVKEIREIAELLYDKIGAISPSSDEGKRYVVLARTELELAVMIAVKGASRG